MGGKAAVGFLLHPFDFKEIDPLLSWGSSLAELFVRGGDEWAQPELPAKLFASLHEGGKIS